ncbi:unnamed protein product [Symbiodinium sp. CCMP2592]|nr:unnamed protein product [Symbiodinium sp. CCMP2592]
MVCASWTMRQPAFGSMSFRLLGWGDWGVRCASDCWQVSSHGRVSNTTGKVHNGYLTCSGYRKARIGGKLYNVHRLVAAAFLGPPADPNCWQVNHLDGDPSNNHLSNLQYVTPAENQRHSWATNLGRQTAAAKLGRPIVWRPCGEETWSICSSHREAERLLGVSTGSVSRCLNGFARRASGNGVWYEFNAAPSDEESPLPAEIWQAGRYPGEPDIIPNLMVSNHGRISQARVGTASRGTRLRNGYYAFVRAYRYMLVHRAVAATFLGQPDTADTQVNHKDLNRGNNRLENLEYVTAAQNSKHSWQMRPRDMRKPFVGKEVQACCIASDSSTRPWLDFDSISAAARHTGISKDRIARICKGLGRSASWHFRFAPKELIPGEEWRAVVLEGARRSPC